MKKLYVLISAALLISACGKQAANTPQATLTIPITGTPARTATSVRPTASVTPVLRQAQDKVPSPTATNVSPTATATPVPTPTATETPLVAPQPTPADDWWQESTPAEQGLDPQLVSQLYQKAEKIRTIYGLLVVKNGYLVAEQYFNGHSVHSAHVTASVTKSFTSALIGLALENGFFSSLDQKMLDFFPEYDTLHLDPRKREITLRHLLQMRAGYPFDSSDDFFSQLLSSGNWIRFIIRDYPLVSAPGQRCDYSNASAHVLAGILARATDMTALNFANQYLFEPLDIRVRAWPRDPQGYYAGHGDIRLRPRDLAKFGYLYLNDGVIDGRQIIPAGWIAESWQDYSVSSYGSLGYFRHIRYGYLWWIADVGAYRVYFAWGHGGQYIVIVPELDLLVVSAADAFVRDFSADSWEMEKGIMDLIGEFVAAIEQG